MLSEICDYAAGKVSDINHFNKVNNQFTSREESEERDWDRILSTYISKSLLKTC